MTVKISVPFGTSDNPMPSEYTLLPSCAILIGVALESSAVPPETDNTKSDASKLPNPKGELNTGSFMVTSIVKLLEVKDTEEMVGASLSIIKILFAPSEPVVPGEGRNSIASTLLSFLIDPPFISNEVVDL